MTTTEEIPEWKLREMDYERRKGLAKDAIYQWFREDLGLVLLPPDDMVDHLATWVRARWETKADDWNYSPRGLGLNWLPCFICGADGRPNEHGSTAQTDMAAFTRSEEAGREILAIFESLGLKAELDLRRASEGRFQVKAGACTMHEPNLRLLEYLTARDKKITRSKLLYCIPDAPKGA